MSNPAMSKVQENLDKGSWWSGAVSDSQVADLERAYSAPSATAAQRGLLTMKGVVDRTIVLFLILLASAAVTWRIADANPGLGSLLMFAGMGVGLVMGLVIAWKQIVNPVAIAAYAVAEGLLVGGVSVFFEAAYPGIVSTAIVATLTVFAAMFLGWRTGLIRVTSRSRRIFMMCLGGYALFALVNFVFAMFGTNEGWGIFGQSSGMGILISLFATGLASYSLAVDFDTANEAVESQKFPQAFSWYLAFGFLMTLVWLYIEILRLLARLRDN